jgi:hypothetical protein
MAQRPTKRQLEKGYAFEPGREMNVYDDVDPHLVLIRLVWSPEGWVIHWNKSFLEQIRSDDAALKTAYEMVDSLKESLAKVLGVQ